MKINLGDFLANLHYDSLRTRDRSTLTNKELKLLEIIIERRLRIENKNEVEKSVQEDNIFSVYSGLVAIAQDYQDCQSHLESGGKLN